MSALGGSGRAAPKEEETLTILRGRCNMSARVVDFLSYRSKAGSPKRKGAAMQQIADWLEKLGMSEYAQRFAENGIGFAALRHLTDQDLKDIGVLLGHRRI
jgi:hypothetical protein